MVPDGRMRDPGVYLKLASARFANYPSLNLSRHLRTLSLKAASRRTHRRIIAGSFHAALMAWIQLRFSLLQRTFPTALRKLHLCVALAY
jgi:hypothetical protein